MLGASEKLRKEIISLAMSVCPSVCMEQLGSHWTDFNEILYLIFFFFFFLKNCRENIIGTKILQK